MPNAPMARERRPSRAPAGRRTRARIAAVAGLVAGIALVAVIVGGALTGSLPGAGVAAASPAPSGASAAPSGTSSPGPDGTSPAPPSASPRASAAPSTVPVPSPTADPAVLAARLDARLAELRKRAAIPGVSAAIVWDDGRRWLGASGSADLAARTPMTTGTGFAFASVSKTLTAAVVLQLVGEGSLSLDQPVAPLLPAYKLDPRITLRMLLDHTSGLPDYFLNPKIDKPLQAAPDAAWTPERTWTYVLPKRPVPGTRWVYSNANYLLLGELVEVVTGRPLPTEIRERLLDPLGLETAWYQVVEKPRVDGATGYRRVAKSGGGVRNVAVAPPSEIMPFRSVVTAAGGAGSIAATALDAARWMGAFAKGEVLPGDVQAEMLADAAVTKAMGARIPYGLGIQVVTLDGRRALGHSGRYLGFRNVVMYLPEAGLTIAVMTNQGTYDPAKIATMLLRIAAPRPVVTPSAPPAAPPGSPAASESPDPSSG